MSKRGFSLLEILIGLGLFAVMSAAVNLLLFSSLKSGRKAAATTAVRTEGGYVLNAIITTVKFSRQITQCGSDAITVITQGGDTLTYRYQTLTEPDSIASESAGMVSSLTSGQIAVNLTGCPESKMFKCDAENKRVEVCFAVENAQAGDVSEKAGSGAGVIFQGQATLRND